MAVALAPILSQAAPYIAAAAPALFSIGRQAAMNFSKKAVSDILTTVAKKAASQEGRESLIKAASAGTRLGLTAGKEVLTGLHKFNILGNQSYNRLTGGIDRVGASLQKAMGSLFKVNKLFPR